MKKKLTWKKVAQNWMKIADKFETERHTLRRSVKMKPSKPNIKNKIIGIRVTKQEKEAIRQDARRENRTISNYMLNLWQVKKNNKKI